MRKLELGAGPDRHTPGYLHNDINPCVGIDIVGPAWEIDDADVSDGSLDEVIAIAFMEHLTYAEFAATCENVRRMLRPGGVFLFDVPDLAAWCRYFLDPPPEFDQAYVLRTLYGWQRFDGDVHRSGWTADLLEEYVAKAGFRWCAVEKVPVEFRARLIYRYRFTRPELDAHFYVRAEK